MGHWTDNWTFVIRREEESFAKSFFEDVTVGNLFMDLFREALKLDRNYYIRYTENMVGVGRPDSRLLFYFSETDGEQIAYFVNIGRVSLEDVRNSIYTFRKHIANNIYEVQTLTGGAFDPESGRYIKEPAESASGSAGHASNTDNASTVYMPYSNDDLSIENKVEIAVKEYDAIVRSMLMSGKFITKRQGAILIARNFDKETCAAIGERLNVTRQRISSIDKDGTEIFFATAKKYLANSNYTDDIFTFVESLDENVIELLIERLSDNRIGLEIFEYVSQLINETINSDDYESKISKVIFNHKSCKKCMLYRAEECPGLGNPDECEYYEESPDIDEEELERWSTIKTTIDRIRKQKNKAVK